MSITAADALIWGLLGAIVFAAGILRGFSGFGSALLVVPSLGFIMGPASAVAIATLLEGFATLLLFRPAIPHTDTRLIATMVPAASAAVPLGHALLTRLDPVVSNLLISFAVICLTLWFMAGARLKFPRGKTGQIAAGGLSGFLTGFGGVGGPPLVLYIVSGEGSAAVKRANIIIVSGLALIAAIVSMAAFQLLDYRSLTGGFLLAPIFLVGGVFGTRLFLIAREQIYQRVAIGSLAALSAILFLANLARVIA